MKLLLARHGETSFNRARKFYGAADVELDDRGRKQAQELAQKLMICQPTVLVQTNLKRTHQTLAPLRHHFPQLPVITLPELAEKGFGDWEGLDADEIQSRYPAEWQKWLQAPLTYTPPTNESFAHFSKRVRRGLAWLEKHLTADDVAVVIAHLGSIRIIYQELVDPSADFYDLDFKAACYSSITIDDSKVTNIELNQ